MLGFQEGARRIVKCDGGYVTGFDAYMGFANGFSEKTVVALRVKCSSGKITVEFSSGSLPDTTVFGNLMDQTLKPLSGASASGLQQPCVVLCVCLVLTSSLLCACSGLPTGAWCGRDGVAARGVIRQGEHRQDRRLPAALWLRVSSSGCLVGANAQHSMLT